MGKYIETTFRILGIVVTAFLCYYLMACQNDSQQKTKVVIPSTPEGVCRLWQTYLDKNELDNAMQLGSPQTQVWLKENKALFLAEEIPEEPTQFVTMLCEEKEDKAICKYIIQEEEDVIEDFFTLINANGQWLIHIEDAASTSPDEKTFDMMKKALNLN